MKLLKSCALLLITTALVGVSPAKARESTACYTVDATRGWQYLQLSNTFSQIVSIRGEWTVDVINYDRVGPGGYGTVETDYTDYAGTPYDEDIPLGALLIGEPGSSYSWLNEPQQLSKPVNNVALRINDNDLALGDNYGAMRVCFTN